jgi:hypothetical protein
LGIVLKNEFLDSKKYFFFLREKNYKLNLSTEQIQKI